MTNYNLKKRLIDFAVSMIDLSEILPKTTAAQHIANQIMRSGTSPAANYAESQSAESRKDFIHKMKISLKELRETLVWLKIITKKYTTLDINLALKECDELIRIFVKNIYTAENRKNSNI